MEPRFSIRTKLFLAILTILLVSYSTLLYSTITTLTRSQQREVGRDLEAHLNYARSKYKDRPEVLKYSLLQPVSAAPVQEHLKSRDSVWLKDALARWEKVLTFADVLTIVDPNEKVIARLSSDQRGDRLVLTDLLDQALQSRKVLVSTEVVAIGDLCQEVAKGDCPLDGPNGEAMVAFVAIPVIGADGTLLGGVVAGDILNHETHIPDHIREVFGSEVEVVVTQQDVPISSSFATDSAHSFTLTPAITSLLAKGEHYLGEMVIGKKPYEMAIEPLFNSHGQFIGSLSVALSRESYTKVSRENLANILISAVIGIICSFVVALLVARRLTGPLRALARSARMIEAGDLNQRVTVTVQDEVGVLAGAFNKMVNALVEHNRLISAKNEELQELNEHLEQKVTGRTADLAMEKERLEAVLTSMAEGVVVTDGEDRVILFNPAAQQLFDMIPFRVMGQSVEHICENGGFCSLIDRIKEIKAVGGGAVGWQETLLVNGKKLKMNLVALANDRGEFAGVLMTIRDVTTEEQIDTMKTEFISTVSHELKTPLTSIKGSLQLLLNRGKWLTETERQLLSVCFRNTQRLIRLISEILDISKIESGGAFFKFRPLSMAELVVYASEEIKSFAMSRDITIVNNVGGHLPSVYGDHDRLIQVLTNLLSNAVKFSPEGKIVMVSAAQEGNYLRVSVADRGKAILREDREKLFKKFQQIDRGDGYKIGGTGLGLAICKEIVERHHGRIFYTSDKENINMFSFTVPIVGEDHGKE